jgi:hypothetical protein
MAFDDDRIAVDVKELPPVLQRALASVGYGRKNIDVKPAERASMGGLSGDGYQAFAMIVNLETGEYVTEWGSWGGPNMFNPQNAVDNDRKDYPIPVNGAVITGLQGGGRPVYATIRVNPAALAPLLPAKAELSERQRVILGIVRGTKGGAYRIEALKEYGVTTAEIDTLVAGGFMKRNKAGAISMTTAGENEAMTGGRRDSIVYEYRRAARGW